MSATKRRLAELCAEASGQMLDLGHAPAKWQPAGTGRAKIRCSRLGCGMEARVDAKDGEIQGDAHQKECAG